MKSIRFKGMIFSLILIFVVVSILGIGAYYRFKTILIQEIDQSVVGIAKESADHLSYFVDHFVLSLTELAKNDAMKDMDWDKQKGILKEQINPYYLEIAVVDYKGKAHYIDGTVLDLSDRPYIQESIYRGKTAFSEVLVSRKTGQNVIMVSVPIYKQGIIKGALIARLNVDFLADFELARGYGDSGQSYIISRTGSFIASSDVHRKDNYNLLSTAQKDDRYLDFSEFFKKSLISSYGYGSFTYRENKLLMGYSNVEGTNWKVYIGTS